MKSAHQIVSDVFEERNIGGDIAAINSSKALGELIRQHPSPTMTRTLTRDERHVARRHARRPRDPVQQKLQSSFTIRAAAEEKPQSEDPGPRLSDIVAKLYTECGVAREATTDDADLDEDEDPAAFFRGRSQSAPAALFHERWQSAPTRMLEFERCILCGCDKFTSSVFATPCVLCGAHSNRTPPIKLSKEDRPKSNLPSRLAEIAAACRQRRLGDQQQTYF